jgi:hypothetical protein
MPFVTIVMLVRNRIYALPTSTQSIVGTRSAKGGPKRGSPRKLVIELTRMAQAPGVHVAFVLGGTSGNIGEQLKIAKAIRKSPVRNIL